MLAAWLSGGAGTLDEDADHKPIRAHQRLLREFLEEHVGDGRALRAFIAWEQLYEPAAALAMR